MDTVIIVLAFNVTVVALVALSLGHRDVAKEAIKALGRLAGK
jgi:hypothetical protein